MICEHALQQDDVDITVLNTAPTWRSIHSVGLMRRSIGGGAQLVIDLVRLMATLFKTKFDVIHLTTSGSLATVRDVLVSYIASFFNVALVYHIHFGRIPKIAGANTLEWRLIRQVMRRASTVIVLDRASCKMVEDYDPSINVCLVPNCIGVVSLPDCEQYTNTLKTLLFTGWVVPTKGIKELVEAWAMINPTGWRLNIVGSVEHWYREQLMAQYQPKSIHFIGQLPHTLAMEQMEKCDLFVLPSYTEGFPNVILEAMAFGRAIIATDVGAIPEVLEDGAGILFKSQSTESLRDVLNKVLSDSELRSRIGTCARKKVIENFTIDIVFNSYMTIWKDVSTSN